jgi:hypothetical protein
MQECTPAVEGDTRFPWIHKRDPVTFHLMNTSFSKNHAEVPRWRALQKVSWFLDGSGGESQC